MSEIQDLKDKATNRPLTVQKGESCNISGEFVDAEGDPIQKSGILTFTLTLYDETTKSIINSRNDQSVLDVNGGTVETKGSFTVRLDAADNTIVGSPSVGSREAHIARFKWTYNDGVTTRTGIHEVRLYVEETATPV